MQASRSTEGHRASETRAEQSRAEKEDLTMEEKLSSKAKRRYRRSKIFDLAVSSMAGLLVIAASALKIFNLDNSLDSTTEKVLIALLTGIAGTVLGILLARRKEGKGDE